MPLNLVSSISRVQLVCRVLVIHILRQKTFVSVVIWRSRRLVLAFEHECFAVRYIPSATERSRPQGLVGLASRFSVPSARRPLHQSSKNSIMPLPSVPPICTEKSRLSGLDATGTLGGTALEAVGELAVDGLEVLHAAGTSGLSPLGLLAPVVCGGMLVLVLHSFSAVAMRCRWSVQVSVGWREVCDVHFLTLALG